jgi:outer membrane protein
MRLQHQRIRTALKAAVAVVLLAGSVTAQTPRKLTIEDTRRLALEFNRTYLEAQQDEVKAEGDITKARAGALPEINLNANYNRNFIIPSFFITGTDLANPGGESRTIEFQTSFKNNFGATISLKQSIWQGGKVFTALQIARLYKNYSTEVADQVKASVIYQAEVLYYTTILNRSRLAVLQKDFEANSYNLEVVEKSYSQGLVSEYELLRARVEKSNLIPQILAAESQVRLSEKRLKSFLGLDLGESLSLVERTDDTTLSSLPPLPSAKNRALARRPEVLQLDYLTDITGKAISVAKAEYWPSLKAVSSYNWSSQSDALTLDENISRSLTAGLELTFPIFSGLERSGTVSQAKADHIQTRLKAAQLDDDVRLQVEEAYDRILQAKKSLDVTGETIAQAEEGLKIANLRYESGVGTQLEVLSAQAALTDARNAQAEALFFFREARARLKRDATIDLETIGAEE